MSESVLASGPEVRVPKDDQGQRYREVRECRQCG